MATPAKKGDSKKRDPYKEYAAKKAGRPYPNLVDNMRASRGK